MTTLKNEGFYDAPAARRLAMSAMSVGGPGWNSDVLTEVNSLQISVEFAATGGNLEVIITDSTTMTQSPDYFNAWNDPANYDSDLDRLRRSNMNAVINYFSRLGFVVKRDRSGILNQFDWKISW